MPNQQIHQFTPLRGRKLANRHDVGAFDLCSGVCRHSSHRLRHALEVGRQVLGLLPGQDRQAKLQAAQRQNHGHRECSGRRPQFCREREADIPVDHERQRGQVELVEQHITGLVQVLETEYRHPLDDDSRHQRVIKQHHRRRQQRRHAGGCRWIAAQAEYDAPPEPGMGQHQDHADRHGSRWTGCTQQRLQIGLMDH